ncbi:MarR family winged helix-turn-helix transcriptional regulator [Umezawaea sp. NPDC059074]|uniref:MarR family winged helix-turn-helix transcriptional regulator n=1 Tax=Umezawaea sp. NPDC059074 TaxID=3346716 RepID=UPI0036C9B2EE
MNSESTSRTGPPHATDRPGDTSPFALGLLLRRAHNRTTSELVAALRPLGLEFRHFAALIELSNDSPLSQRELVERMGTDKVSMVRIVDDLEAAGLAVRRTVSGDRRIRAVDLTDRGRQVFAEAHIAAADIAERLVVHLGRGELDQLLDILTRYTYPPQT